MYFFLRNFWRHDNLGFRHESLVYLRNILVFFVPILRRDHQDERRRIRFCRECNHTNRISPHDICNSQKWEYRWQYPGGKPTILERHCTYFWNRILHIFLVRPNWNIWMAYTMASWDLWVCSNKQLWLNLISGNKERFVKAAKLTIFKRFLTILTFVKNSWFWLLWLNEWPN